VGAVGQNRQIRGGAPMVMNILVGSRYGGTIGRSSARFKSVGGWAGRVRDIPTDVGSIEIVRHWEDRRVLSKVNLCEKFWQKIWKDLLEIFVSNLVRRPEKLRTSPWLPYTPDSERAPERLLGLLTIIRV